MSWCLLTNGHSLHMELDAKMEDTQLELQMPLSAQTQKEFHEAFHSEIETTWCKFKMQLAEVTGDFVQVLYLTWPKCETQPKEVKACASCMAGMQSTTEAWADCRCCRRTGTGAGMAQPPKLNGSTSWAVFQWHINMVVEHNNWIPCNKVTFMITTLNKLAARILHGVSTRVMYEEVTEVATVTTIWKKHSELSRRGGPSMSGNSCRCLPLR